MRDLSAVSFPYDWSMGAFCPTRHGYVWQIEQENVLIQTYISREPQPVEENSEVGCVGFVHEPNGSTSDPLIACDINTTHMLPCENKTSRNISHDKHSACATVPWHSEYIIMPHRVSQNKLQSKFTPTMCELYTEMYTITEIASV